MKRPWQIWCWFLTCLAIVAGPMGWLTHRALELDQQTAVAAGRESQEENVGPVLWQADTFLIPILAEEAARPSVAYSAAWQPGPADSPGTGLNTANADLAAPRFEPSEYVYLHFELHEDGSLTSPTIAGGQKQPGAPEPNSDRRAEIPPGLEQLRSQLHYKALLDELPQETIAELNPALLTAGKANALTPTEGTLVDTIGLPQFESKLAIAQESQTNEPRLQQQVDNQIFRGNRRDVQQRAQRGGEAWSKRNSAYQSMGLKQLATNFGRFDPSLWAGVGISRPVWIGENLLLLRRVQFGAQQRIQGCWLNWPKIQSRLLNIAAEAQIDGAALRPITSRTPESDVTPGRMLATLPVQLVLPEVSVRPPPFSPIRAALLVAWACLALAGAAAAILLRGVLVLSERRSAFVSAVTHELRTPLTTFRIYSEMLADDMVPEGERRRQYLETLRTEADRLSHLVENVLAYSRIERGRPQTRRESIALGALIERARPRLAARAEEAGMTLLVEPSDAADSSPVDTDPAAVEQILFNLVDNAAKYAAGASDRRIHLRASAGQIQVDDHGPGIDRRTSRRLFKPFSKSADDAARTAPGVGLGLALCRRLARDLGGDLQVADSANPGASLLLTLPLAQQ